MSDNNDKIRDGMAKAMCAVETRSKAATLEEVASGIERWTRHRYEAERLISELADYGIELRAQESDAGQQWQYGIKSDGDDEPWSDISEDLDWLIDEAGSMGSCGDAIVRRRKAGPWERVDAK